MNDADTSPLIRMQGVAVRYAPPGARELRIALPDLEIRAGERVALTGPSGCGKTTLLAALSGIARASEGRVVVDGRDLSSLSGYRLDLFRAKTFGIVFQSFNLLESSPVRRNIELPLHFSGRSGPAAAVWIDELLDRVGLAEKASLTPGRLSTGERQRLAIARAVAGGPSVLLADEPTSNLDAGNCSRVMELLLELSASRRTLVAATHDDRILDRFDRVIRMKLER
jgi:putative ABC transport system ATP-binding protein